MNDSYNFLDIDKLKEALILLVRAILIGYNPYHTHIIKHKLTEAIPALNCIAQKNDNMAELAYKVILLIMIHLDKDNFCMLALKNRWNKNKYNKISESVKQLLLEEISDNARNITKEYVESKLQEAGLNSGEFKGLIDAFKQIDNTNPIINILES